MAQNAMSDQGLHCLLTENSIKFWIKVKNSTQQPLKQKWTGPIDNSRQVHLAFKNGLITTSIYTYDVDLDPQT